MKRVLRKSITIFMIVSIVAGLTSCECKHEWKEATCYTPKTCIECGAEEGAVLSHVWRDASCETAKTCEKCEKTEGEALGHKWTEATCTEDSVCSVCGEKGEKAKGHTAEKVEGTAPACETEGATDGERCSVCKTVIKEQETIAATGHYLVDHLGKPATCTESGCEDYVTCKKCSYSTYKPIETTGHKYVHGVCSTCKEVDIEYLNELEQVVNMFNEGLDNLSTSIFHLERYLMSYARFQFNEYSKYVRSSYSSYKEMLDYCKNHSNMSEFKSDTQKVVDVLYSICFDVLSTNERVDKHNELDECILSLSNKLSKRIKAIEKVLPEVE